MILIPTKEHFIDSIKISKENVDDNEENFFPQSYVTNTDREDQCVDYLKTFESNFESSWKGKLLLYSKNEFGLLKPICTTLRPTLSHDSQHFQLSSLVKFVSRSLVMEALENTNQNPNVILSQTSVIDRKIGDCFELAILLTSLLLGANYDAFVVFGCASEWICKNDFSRVVLPHEHETQMRHLSSNDIIGPWHDHSLEKDNIHCWILVRGGARNMENMIFINPSSGHSFSVEDSPFLKIYSIWNHRNIWIHKPINIEYTTCFDVTNETLWQPVFREDSLGLPSTSIANLQSWVDPFKLTQVKKSLPQVWFYNKAILEIYEDNCSHLNTERKTYYADHQRVDIESCHEIFNIENPNSFLKQRIRFPREQKYIETFTRGHKAALHTTIVCSGYCREMSFFPGDRLDGLIHWKERIGETIEIIFEGRSDNLVSSHLVLTTNENKIKEFALITLKSNVGKTQQGIQSIKQTFGESQKQSQKRPHKFLFNFIQNEIVIDYFPCEKRTLPQTVILPRCSFRNDANGDQEAFTVEKKCLSIVRTLYTEMSSIPLLNRSKARQRFQKDEMKSVKRLGFHSNHNDHSDSNQEIWVDNKITESEINDIREDEAKSLSTICKEALKNRLYERKQALTQRIEEEKNCLSTSDHQHKNRKLHLDVLQKRFQILESFDCSANILQTTDENPCPPC